MKSIKLGRGPSLIGGITAIVCICFCVVMSIIAFKTRQFFFLIFAGLFVVAYISMAVYHFSNATKKNRHSIVDIVDSREEPDPLSPNESQGEQVTPNGEPLASGEPLYCPYCGKKVESDFIYCKYCGKKLN